MSSVDKISAAVEEIDIPEVENRATPIILIHNDSGTTFQYYLIEPLERSIYAISNPYFSSGSRPPGGIPELAKNYLKAIQKEITGDVILGGWSFGGCVAFEIARILDESSNLRVKGLLLLDTYCPWSKGTWRNAQPPLSFPDTTPEKTKELVSKSFSNAREMMTTWPKPAAFKTPPVVMICARESKPTRDLSKPNSDADGQLGWTVFDWLDLLSIEDVAGNHYTMFEEELVEGLSQKIRDACNLFDQIL